MKTHLVVTGIGMLTPVGLRAPEALHSIRSGVSRLALQQIPDRLQEWISGGEVLTWTKEDREHRLKRMAELALDEALEQAGIGRDPRRPGPTGLFIAAPEAHRPGYKFPAEGFDPRGWFAEMGYSLPSTTQVFAQGASGAQLALERAAALLGESSSPAFCLIGAADTLLQLRVIRWLEDSYRLKCSYHNDGLMPGEAAVFLVVESEPAAIARKANILARILSTTIDNEPATILGDEPNTAGGLTRAVRTAVNEAGVAVSDLNAIWSDLNGESYRAREWGFTEVRLQLQTHTELIHPADCHGDLGAATAANLLAMAALSQAANWAIGRPQLVVTSADGGARCASVIGPGPNPVENGAVKVSVGLPAPFSNAPKFPDLGPDEEEFAKSVNPAQSYFRWQLRQEHADELASLFAQRKAVLQNPELPWTRAIEPEQRILNHVDAVMAGGAESIWAVSSGILSDDEGLSFAGALVLATMNESGALQRLTQAFDSDAPTNLDGVAEGLRHAPSTIHLTKFLSHWLSHPRPDVQAMAARVAGDRRDPDARTLAPLFDSQDPAVLCAAATAAGRMPQGPLDSQLERLIDHPEVAVRSAALRGARRSGAANSEARCRALAGSPEFDAVACSLLALTGKPTDFAALDFAAKTFPERDYILALGVLGRVNAIPRLIELLKEGEPLNLAAAEALYRITGFDERHEVTVTEMIDLIDEQIEESRTEMQRVTDPAKWTEWLQSNRERFRPEQRWRLGQPFSAQVCLDELRNPTTTMADRERAAIELCLMTGMNIPFEPDWFVRRQEAAIGAWQNAIPR